jgi:hypothetical protein
MHDKMGARMKSIDSAAGVGIMKNAFEVKLDVI